MNIAIFAAVGCKNLGDELIVKNEITYFEKKYSQNGTLPKFSVFTYDVQHPFFQKENIEYIEYFPIGLRKGGYMRNIGNYFSFLTTLFWADMLVVGGGGLFYDSEKQVSDKTLDLWVFRSRHFRVLIKQVVFYGVSLDVKKPVNFTKVQKIFSWAHKIYVRDEDSRKFLYTLGIHAHEIDDPVMSDNQDFHPRKKNCLKILSSTKFDLGDLGDIDFRGKKIGIAFRPGYLSGSGIKEIEVAKMWELLHFLIGHGAKKIVLLPHSLHPHDMQANDGKFLRQFISPKVDMPESIEEVYQYYAHKKIDMCFSMRLHSMILSHIYSIPFIAFTYGKKTQEYIKKIS